jgi:hypothetical protein
MAENEKSIKEQIEENQRKLGIQSPDNLEINLDELRTGEQTTEFIREKIAHLEGQERENTKHYVEGVIAKMRQDKQNGEKT